MTDQESQNQIIIPPELTGNIVTGEKLLIAGGIGLIAVGLWRLIESKNWGEAGSFITVGIVLLGASRLNRVFRNDYINDLITKNKKGTDGDGI